MASSQNLSSQENQRLTLDDIQEFIYNIKFKFNKESFMIIS